MMTMTNQYSDESPEIPSELASLVASLDRLAAADSTCPAGLEDRVGLASLVSLHGLAGVQAVLDRLAESDGAGAPLGLEARVFAASTAGLSSAHLHLADDQRSPHDARRRARSPMFSPARLRAIAAVLFIGLGSAVTWQALRPRAVPSVSIASSGTATDLRHLSTEEISARLDEGFDALLSAVADVNTRASSREADANSYSGSIDDLFGEGVSG